ncbi:MAG TPA: DHHA1 domain-containing protein, partial [Chitinophagaceae bacterium]
DLVKANAFDANKLIKEEVAPFIGGGGGGQKFLATASGTDAANIEKLITHFKNLLK